jgi:lactoylglutathione lyase
MRYLHTMVRVADIDRALDFYVNKLGMKEVRRTTNEGGRYTLIFLAASEDEATGKSSKAPLLELTYNWDPENYGEGRNFGHLAFEVDNIYDTCARLQAAGVTINRPPRDGSMAFVRSPDNISIELLQKGPALPPREPWKSMQNSGKW